MRPLLLGLMLAWPAAAFGQGDAEHGSRLAVENCSRCHDVSPEGAFKTYPPSFASIAVYRGEDQIRARIIFPPLHTAMPEPIYFLMAGDVDDLVAYIMSLERSPK
jgi:mono/diheme cytochrome c family protein